MSITLPKLYKDSYDLALGIFSVTKSFPKHARPTLGRKLEENAVELASGVRLLLLTSRRKEELKLNQIHSATVFSDQLKLLIQLARDLEIISSTKFGDLSKTLESIGSQLGGLYKHLGGEDGLSS